MNKKVLFYPSAYSLHTAYKSFLTNPPKGYEFIYRNNPKSPFEKFKGIKFLKRIYKIMISITKKDLSQRILKKEQIPEQIDLLFSTGVLYNGDKPWVIDLLDNPYCLGGYNYDLFIKNKPEIGKTLLSFKCKAIVCANESSVELMKKHFSKELLKKITLIRPAGPSPKEKAKKKGKEFQILFMGSIKNPDDFYLKGGFETIKAFEKLQKKYKNAKLVIRCKIPKEIKSRVEKNKGIELIENFISGKEIEELYSNSDVLSCPSHVYMLMIWLEAMSHGIPIVALDTYATKDYIVSGENGFLVKKSSKIPYNKPSYPVNVREPNFIRSIKEQDDTVIDGLVEKFEILMKDRYLVKKINQNNLKLIKTKFSAKKRNKEFKKLFDEIFRFI